MVDLDVPRNDTRVPLLHWLATNVTRPVPLSANTTGASLVVPSNNSVPYLQPSPPVGDIPHSYTFILMQQPRNFTLPEQYSDLADNRVGFNITQFAADANLTMGLAATWMTVQNVTETENENATSTSTFPPARPSETGGGDGDGPLGDGGKLEVGGKAFWAGMSTVLLAGVFAVAL
ncbi:hypothetical protein BDW02DRAFT_565453 [Decorospora gaudefroyi]|uniref:PEBP-like protein n=1 Tax=Decorospora gaudefroyi TaxID=184978 RepID=A0A6A5KQS9_9PLEO|nr:hypothetical protein BDW02DRAFT_565453 [Decorospora gaudefroyi]